MVAGKHSELPSAAEAFSAGRHLAADFALLERVVVLVEVLVPRALQVILADEHTPLLPRCLASKTSPFVMSHVPRTWRSSYDRRSMTTPGAPNPAGR